MIDTGDPDRRTDIRSLSNHATWRGVYRLCHVALPDGGEAPEESDEETHFKELLREHPEIVVSDTGAWRASASAMLDVYCDLEVPEEERPVEVPLTSFSTSARYASAESDPWDSEEGGSDWPHVVITATPRELRAFWDSQTDSLIEQQIDEGKLERGREEESP